MEAAKVEGVPDQTTVPVYWLVSVIVVIGTAPTAGAVTPEMAKRLIVESVAGNTAATVPELAAFVAAAPATVRLLAATPEKVLPVFAVRTRFAVYTVLAAKVLADGDHVMVPVYCAVLIAVVTGVAPSTGAVTPGMENRVTAVAGAAPVAGNTAVTVPELIAFVAVAPATVKLLAATPATVYPALGLRLIVAVYAVEAANVLADGDQVMVPVYCVVSVIVVTGVAPRTGAVTPAMERMFTAVAAGAPVTGNTAVTVPELIAFVAAAPATVKLLAATPATVYPALGLRLIVAVYTVEAANVLADGDQVMLPVYCVVSVIVVTGVAPVTGAVTPAMESWVTALAGVAVVAGNTAVTVPELTAFVAVAPATVKLLAATPDKVQPLFAVKTMSLPQPSQSIEVGACQALRLRPRSRTILASVLTLWCGGMVNQPGRSARLLKTTAC